MSRYAALPRAIALAVPLSFGAWIVQAADIIRTAEKFGRFDGFLHLLEAADMVEVLEGTGPFTVFAPVDEAFGQLPPGVIEWLLGEETGKALEAVLGAPPGSFWWSRSRPPLRKPKVEPSRRPK
jgi:hypothetical protein